MLLSVRYPDKKKLVNADGSSFFIKMKQNPKPLILLLENDNFKHAQNERYQKF